MKRYIRSSRIIPPKYHDGDVVFIGDARGYHGRFRLIGDINNFPDELAPYIRRIYKDSAEPNVYVAEYNIYEYREHLFEEDYRAFFDMITPILERAGFEIQ